MCDGSVLKSKNNFGRNAIEEGNLIGNTLDWLFVQDKDQDIRMGFIKDFKCEKDVNGNFIVSKVTPKFIWKSCDLP